MIRNLIRIQNASYQVQRSLQWISRNKWDLIAFISLSFAVFFAVWAASPVWDNIIHDILTGR